MSEGGEERRVYSIRGLDRDLYERFTSLARELNMTVGELMNLAMRITLSLIEAGRIAGVRAAEIIGAISGGLLRAPMEMAKAALEKAIEYEVISSVSELEVTRSDLERAEKPVVFVGMRRLVFADDVTWELLDEKVKAIRLVREVEVPEHIPRLKLARKCTGVERIVVRRRREEAKAQA